MDRNRLNPFINTVNLFVAAQALQAKTQNKQHRVVVLSQRCWKINVVLNGLKNEF